VSQWSNIGQEKFTTETQRTQRNGIGHQFRRGCLKISLRARQSLAVHPAQSR